MADKQLIVTLNFVGNPGSAGQSIEQLNSQLGQTASQIDKLKLAFGAIGLAADAALVGSVKSAIDFNTQMMQVANNTNMTTQQMQQMSNTVKDMSTATGQSIATLTGGFQHLFNLTQNITTSQAELKVANEAAVATGANASEMANTLGNAMHEYGLDVSTATTQQGQYNDILANATQTMGVLHLASTLANTDMSNWAEQTARATATAANLGIPLDQVSAAIATLTKHGFPDLAEAQTQVVNIMTHMIHPAAAARTELEALSKTTGVDLVSDFSAAGLSTKGLTGVMADLHEAYGRLGLSTADQTEETMKLLNAQRGGLGMMTLLGTGAQDYSSILAQLDDKQKVASVTQDQFNRTMQTAGQRLAVLKADFHVMAIDMGNAFLPALEKIAAVLIPVVDALSKFAAANPNLTAGLLAVLGIGGTVVGGRAVLSKLVGIIGMPLGPLNTFVGAGGGGLFGGKGGVGGLAQTGVMNVTANVVNIAGAGAALSQVGAAEGAAVDTAAIDTAAAEAAGAASSVTLTALAPVIGMAVALGFGVYEGAKQYGTAQKQIPGRGTAPSGKDDLLDAIKTAGTTIAKGAEDAGKTIASAASYLTRTPTVNSSGRTISAGENTPALTKDAYEYTKALQAANAAVRQQTTDATTNAAALQMMQRGIEASVAVTDAFDQKMRQLDVSEQQLNTSMQQLNPYTEAQLQLTAARTQATTAEAVALGKLVGAYESGLGLQQVYANASSEYASQADAITNAYDAIIQKQKEGKPLSEAEINLMQQKNQWLGRLKGGQQDDIILQGEAAGANVDLMNAQDQLNQMLKQGIDSGPQYQDALKKVQDATTNAKQYGLDPTQQAAGEFNQNLSDLQGNISMSLVPAIDNLVQALKDVQNPPPVDIQIADAVAMQQIRDLKAYIESGASMPINVFTAGSSGGAVGVGVQTKAAAGLINSPFTQIATVNELGPEALVMPYAGHFAAGGTVGGGQGPAIVPQGATIIPASQVQDMIARTQAMIDLLANAGAKLGTDGVKAANDYASAAQNVWQALSAEIDFSTKAQQALSTEGFALPSDDFLAKLNAKTSHAVLSLDASAGQLSSDGLKATTDYSNAAQAVWQGLSAEIDFAQKSSEALKQEGFALPSDTFISQLKFSTEHAVTSLRDSAAMLTSGGVTAAQTYAQAAQAVWQGLGAELDFATRYSQAIKGEGFALPTDAFVSELKFSTEHAVTSLRDSAAMLDPDGIQAAQTYATAAKSVWEGLGAELDFAQKYSQDIQGKGFALPTDEFVSKLKFSTEHAVVSMKDSARMLDPDGIKAAQDYSQAAQAVWQALGAELDFADKYSTDIANKGFGLPDNAFVDKLSATSEYSVSVIAKSAQLIGTDGVTAAQSYGQAISSVWQGLGSEVDFATKSSDALRAYGFGLPTPAFLDELITDSEQTAQEMAQAANTVGTDGVKAASDYGDALQKMYGGLGSALQFAQAETSSDVLLNPEQLKKMTDRLVTSSEYIATELADGTATMLAKAPDIVDNLQSFDQDIAPAFTALAGVMDAFDKFANQSLIPSGAAKTFDSNMAIAADAMRAGVKEMSALEADGTLAEFDAIVTQMADAFQKAFDVFGTSTSSGGGSTGSSSSSSSAGLGGVPTSSSSSASSSTVSQEVLAQQARSSLALRLKESLTPSALRFLSDTDLQAIVNGTYTGLNPLQQEEYAGMAQSMLSTGARSGPAPGGHSPNLLTTEISIGAEVIYRAVNQGLVAHQILRIRYP